jgi:branched-chain amino acid transport system ATP-binding protein
MSDDKIFDVQNVSLRFGGVVSLNDVSLHQDRGEILAVIGPNGAGKTSLFNSLTGVYEPQEGTIMFSGRDAKPISIIGRKPHRVSAVGVARTFQASRMFSALTTFENVKIGAESHHGFGVIGAMVIDADLRLRVPWARIPRYFCSTSRRPARTLRKNWDWPI